MAHEVPFPGHRDNCRSGNIGPVWHGSPNYAGDPNNEWVCDECGGVIPAIMKGIVSAVPRSRSLDPRDPDHTRTGIFVYHNCYRCKDGTLPCVEGTPNSCSYPHARNN